jgi:hypothetical protein
MASSDSQQMSELAPQHKRLAMGVKLDGSSMKGGSAPAKPAQKSGGLAQAKKK